MSNNDPLSKTASEKSHWMSRIEKAWWSYLSRIRLLTLPCFDPNGLLVSRTNRRLHLSNSTVHPPAASVPCLFATKWTHQWSNKNQTRTKRWSLNVTKAVRRPGCRMEWWHIWQHSFWHGSYYFPDREECVGISVWILRHCSLGIA